MPPEIILIETCNNLPFLSKLAMSCDSPDIVPAHGRTAATLLKRLKGKSFLPIVFERKLYKIGNGSASASFGLAIQISFAIKACSAAFAGS